MKSLKISRKILALLLTLAIVAALLVPVAAVWAYPTQDWPVRLEGATAYNLSNSTYMSLYASYPVSCTDLGNTSNTYAGVALWRIVGLIDDGDPTTFNSALAAGNYTINLSDSTNYNGNVSSITIANNDSYFLAFMMNGTPFVSGDGKYPLKMMLGNTSKGKAAVGGVVKIKLLGLTQTTAVSVSPVSQAVANGATFNVNMAINTNTAVRGWQMNVNFDATKLSANSVTEGTFLSGYATANGGGTVSGGAATIDNGNGTITIPGYAITGAGAGGPIGIGTLCTISFTAKTGIDNFASITPTAVVLSDYNGAAIPGTTVTGGTVAIGNVPMPDLAVSALWATKTGNTTYTITYTITNLGNAAAAASTTSIVIDSSTTLTVACPGLAVGGNDTETTGTVTISGGSDTIVVTADSTGVVSESNESNNSRTITYALVGANGNTILNANIVSGLVLTAPATIDPWNLVVGSNDITGTANVQCNSNWQLQVNDQNTTKGHMTKWIASSGYDLGTQFTAPLTVGCLSSVDLSGTPQTIATGTPAGQSGNAGQNLTITFHQPVVNSDAVLTGGYSYHIVVTFTASVTF